MGRACLYRSTLALPLLLIMGSGIHAQNVGINTTGSAPNAHALFDADNNGLLLGALLPRLSTASRVAMAGLSGTEDGLVVYDTTTKSFWYWDGTQWVEIGAGGGGGWSLMGNAGTDDAVNFLGTTDAKPLVIRTDGTPRVRITTKGQIETLNTGESVFVGEGAGAASDILTPHESVFIGYRSGNQNTTGVGNTAIGFRTLESSTNSWQNIAIGNYSLQQNTTAGGNTAIGSESMRYNTTGDQNIAIGLRALGQNTTGGNNVAIGSHTLYNNITGSANVSIGNGSMMNNTAGNQNTAIGLTCMSSNTTGGGNTAIGESALAVNQAGSGNVAIGRAALFLDLGSFNVGIGIDALAVQSTGENNVGIGRGAGGTNNSGSNNVFIGAYAGGVPFLGPFNHRSGSVFIGYKAGYNEPDSNKLYIENSTSSTPLIYGEFDTDMVRINHNLGIGSSWFGGGTKVLSFEPGVQPASGVGHAMLFAQVISGVTELRTMDGVGNVTTISPHNFSLVPKSEPMAWAFYSENADLGLRVNVDMMHVVRLVERMSGEPLVHISDLEGGAVESPLNSGPSLEGRVRDLEVALDAALLRIEELQRIVASQGTLQGKP